MTLYANHRDVPKSAWRWQNFSPAELACRGTGSVLINEEALDKLQALRTRLGRPIIITSAYRSPQHNRAVGGAPRSLHMQGVAFDCRMENHNPTAFAAAARAEGFTGFGYYPRSGFIHIDTGPARSWGEPFPQSDTNLITEPPRRPETLGEDRDAQIIGGAGVLAVASQVFKPFDDGTNLVDRVMSIDPIVLLVAGAVALIIWRHKRAAPK